MDPLTPGEPETTPPQPPEPAGATPTPLTETPASPVAAETPTAEGGTPAHSNGAPAARESSAIVHAAETVQTVLTALILAFIFRAFLIEAFIIPTGSMAESLLGEHSTRLCPRCGYTYEFGPIPSVARDGGGESFRGGLQILCPNCHLREDMAEHDIVPKAGDRILVHKWPYVIRGLIGPKRWDVIVFRDPTDPTQNFIKRLIALPGETVELIDGDVYITPPGETTPRIVRKTPAAQSVLWFNVFDQNYVPPRDPTDLSWAWQVERDERYAAEAWTGLEERVIRYLPASDRLGAIRFEPRGSRFYLQDVYGYDRGPSEAKLGASPPLVGDVRLVAEARFRRMRWEIRRDDTNFYLDVDLERRQAVLSARFADSAAPRILGGTDTGSIGVDEPVAVEFGHLDYRVYAKLGGRLILATSDEQYSPRLDHLRSTARVSPVGLRIESSAPLTLRGLRVDRDVHYLNTRQSVRAYENNPFTLGEGEYFVLGDNSPSSHDSREWTRVGPYLQRLVESGQLQLGVIPESQIVGRAFLVYLPAVQPVDERGRWRLPDIGRIRFVR